MRVPSVVLALAALVLVGAAPARAQLCAPGTYSLSGTEPCDPCPAGRYSDTFGSTFCIDCAAGTSSGAGSQVCSPCPEGTANDTSGGLCTTCEDGKIAATIGSTACLQCPQGKTSNETHTACINVAPATGPWAKVAVALLIAGTGLLFVRRRQTA